MDLPFSRVQEREADHIGIMLMAQACYDPRVAPKLWHAMEKVFTPEDEAELDFDFNSTHPSHKKRERRLETLVGEALELQQHASWCYQVKERVQQLLTGASSSDPFLQRVVHIHRQQSSTGRGGRRRNTVGTIHELENEEIIKGLAHELEQHEHQRQRAASEPTL
jgi:predicted Zn-dependent protease